MEEYTLLKLYADVGQFDEVSNVTFKKGSEAYTKFGESVTGDFYYTPGERAEIQKSLDNNDPNDHHGLIKFIERPSTSTEMSKELLRTGFNTADISYIISFPKIDNEFIKEETRSLPEPVVIKFDPRGFDAVKAMIHLTHQKKRDGYRLAEFEIEQDIVYKIIDNKYAVTDDIAEEFYDKEKPKEIKRSIRFQVLMYKFQNEELSAEEKEEFDNLLSAITKEKMAILFKELERSTEKLKRVGIDYKDSLNGLSYLVAFFEPETLLFSKFPVWWNLERFLHIFVRHVSEVQVGERFEKKTVFQYKLKDIKDLIKIVLKTQAKEIEEHLKDNPGKDFKRNGDRSVYYNGDYYVIHIRADGLLLAFYKNS